MRTLLCAVAKSVAGASAGDRDPRRPPAHAADLRTGAAAAGSGRSRGVHRGAPDQTPAPQARASLQAASKIQGDDRFLSWPAGCGESAGAALRCSISVADLAERHHLYPHGGRLALLVGHKDLCTHKIVGYAMGVRMTRNLVIESLRRAVESTRRRPDWCTTGQRQAVLLRGVPENVGGARTKASMSGAGNCHDNAPMENFWATLKTELGLHRRFATRQQATREMTEYIEVFYNRQRIQKQWGIYLGSLRAPIL